MTLSSFRLGVKFWLDYKVSSPPTDEILQIIDLLNKGNHIMTVIQKSWDFKSVVVEHWQRLTQETVANRV